MSVKRKEIERWLESPGTLHIKRRFQHLLVGGVRGIFECVRCARHSLFTLYGRALFPLFYEIFGSPSSASIPYSHNMEEPFSHYFMKYLGHTPPPQASPYSHNMEETFSHYFYEIFGSPSSAINLWWVGELVINIIKWRGETFVGYVFQKD